MFSGYFVAIRRVPVGASVQVLTQLLKILLTVLFLPAENGLSTESAISRLCLASTLSEIVGAIVLLFFYLLFLPRGEGTEKEKYRPLVPLLSITLPLAFPAYTRQALLTLEHSMIPRRLLKHEGATMGSALADYGALHGMALPLLLYPLSPLSSFSSLLVPEFAELKSTNDRAKMGSIASRALSYTLSYASVICVFLFVFGEEISNLIYHTPTASTHLFVLAPIVPLMYLDHVTDAILKGIGEHVYSMWVNITDSLLSIVLLYFLLPHLGIFGYAVVIIVMEGYNFLLSILRLRRRVRLSFSLTSSFVYPMLCAMASSLLTVHLFHLNGSTTPYFFFFLKVIFFVAIFLLFYKAKGLIMRKKLSPR
ncbi:MAG: polysaccharide biosynthesis protein [Clostridia bacterium]|nr:polysaccharide biosynthesis protein [Clostridia bacterium]